MGLVACNPCPPFEPDVQYCVTDKRVQALPTPFPALSKNELQQLWGKELYLGSRFADEADFYRAITAFKSALFLIPAKELSRKAQIEYSIFLSYYLAAKYKEAIETYENSSLPLSASSFPAYRELLITLYDTYGKIECTDKQGHVYELIRQDFPDLADTLSLSSAIIEADFCFLNEQTDKPYVNQLLTDYAFEKKSPKTAGRLQTFFPGAGYYYVGLKNAAVTSFIINSLFIAGTYQLFHKGYPAIALFTLSLEAGWYFGGINGAQIAANEYNERLYERLSKDTLINEKLFPILRLEYAF